MKLLLLVRDGLLRTLSGARVVLRVLSTNRQASPVTDASVAADLGKSLDVHRDLTAKVTFDMIIISDDLSEFPDFIIGQISAAGIGIHTGLLDDLRRGRAADAINAGQADLNTLLSG